MEPALLGLLYQGKAKLTQVKADTRTQFRDQEMGRNAAARTAGGDVVQRGQKVEETASIGSGVAAGQAGLGYVLSPRLGQRPGAASLYLVCG